MKTVPSEDDVERCVSENFQKVFPLCLDFYRAAGNMEPLTGDDAGMIRRGDR